MSSPVLYGVYLARVRFVEASAYKLRPVIVINRPAGSYNIVTVVPVFSSTEPEPTDVILSDWQSAGLRKDSVARVHRLAGIAQVDLLEALGSLEAKDIQTLKQAIKGHLGL